MFLAPIPASFVSLSTFRFTRFSAPHPLLSSLSAAMINALPVPATAGRVVSLFVSYRKNTMAYTHNIANEYTAIGGTNVSFDDPGNLSEEIQD